MKARAVLIVSEFGGDPNRPSLKAVILTGPCEGSGFWLDGHNGVSRALHRSSEEVEVTFCPDDQFCREVKP